MNVQNISSLPDFIDVFIKHNNDKCIEYYNLINKLYLIDV